MELANLLTVINNSFTPELLWGLTIASFAIAVTSIAITPFFVARLPEDYFIREEVPVWWGKRGLDRLIAIASYVAKNLVGGVLFALGFAMLFLPGQGLLTMLMALVLLDFPGKKRLERKFAARASIRQALDWIRKRQGKAPLRF